MIFTIGSDPPSIHLSVLWVWKMPGHAWKHRWSIIFLIEMAITWRGYMYPIDTPISQHIHFALAAMGTHSPPIYHHYWGYPGAPFSRTHPSLLVGGSSHGSSVNDRKEWGLGNWSVILHVKLVKSPTTNQLKLSWCGNYVCMYLHVYPFCSMSENDGRRGTFEDDPPRCMSRGRRSRSK
jgi:hypothetical protein